MIYLRARHALFACLWLLLATGSCFAQALPPTVTKQATSSPANRQLIDGFVDHELAKLADPERVSQARTSLTQFASQPDVTPSFWDDYADALNQKMLPLATSKDLRIRLNAGIICYKIASKAQNARLAGVTNALLADSTEAISLWGIQCAKYVLPKLLQTGNAKAAVAMAREVAKAAMRMKNSVAVLEETYRTLLLNPYLGAGSGADEMKDIPTADLQAYLPQALAFFEFRIKLYDDLDYQPVYTTADTWPCSRFFVTSKVWTSASHAQQVQICQDMFALARGAQKQAGVAQPTKPFVEVVQQVGGSFAVLSDLLPNNSGKSLKQIAKGVSTLPGGATVDEIKTALDRLEQTLKPLGLIGG